MYHSYSLLNLIVAVCLLMSPWAINAIDQPAMAPAAPNTCSEGTGPDYWRSMVLQVYEPVTNNWDIYTASPCSVSPVRLTTSPAFDGFPRWNGDASRLVFASERDGNQEIYAMSSDGSGVTRLTDQAALDTTPAFSPDGTRVTFVSERDGNPEIYVMNADGSGQTRLTSNNLQDFDPDWSPDGRLIAWVQGDATSRRVYVMNADGSNPHALSQSLWNARRPVWSPSGDRLALDGDDNQDGWQDLIEISADGTGSFVVPIPKSVTETDAEDFLMGAWSEDGNTLYFTRASYSINAGKRTLKQARLYYYFSSNGEISTAGPTNSFSYYPSIRSRDHYAPVATLQPIPEYFRAGYYPLSWVIRDPGVSGLNSYTLEFFVLPNGPWTEMNSSCPTIVQHSQSFWSSTCYAPGYPGKKIAFRLHATDKAGNSTISSIPVQGIAYDFLAEGRVSDNRGYPVVSAAVNVDDAIHNPMMTGPQGNAVTYFVQNSSSSRATFTKPGYGSYPSQTWQWKQDRHFSAVLPPVENRLVNGDFESSVSVMDGWQSSGNLPAQPGSGLSGDYAALLGQRCDNHLCLSAPEMLPAYYGSPSFVTDLDGVSHFLDLDNNATYYYTRTPAGVWSVPEAYPLLESPSSLKISSAGTLYFVYTDKNTRIYTLASKSAGGVWNFAPLVLPGTAPKVLAHSYDGQAQLHILYTQSDADPTIYYTRRRADQSWTAPTALLLTVNQKIVLTSGPDGKLHLIYEAPLPDVSPWYAQINPAGQLFNLQKLPLWERESGYSDYDAVSLIAAVNGDLHFLATDPYHSRAAYWRRAAGGTWTSPEVIYGDWMEDYTLLVGPGGEVHVFNEGSNGYTLIYFYKSTENDPFVRSVADPRINTSRLAVSLDEHGQPQLAATGYFTRLVPMELPGESAISQTVTIPSQLANPTLSFRYQLQQEFSGSLSGMEVTVTPDGGTPLRIFTSGRERGSWLHGWADLSTWAGQTVTITFQLRQAAGEWNARLLLDEISLGAWTTPVVQSMSPQKIISNNPGSISLRLSGFNLSAQAQVFIGKYLSPGVTTDPVSGDLLVALPPDLKPGLYTLYLSYPDGQDTVVPFSLQLGYISYLPGTNR